MITPLIIHIFFFIIPFSNSTPCDFFFPLKELNLTRDYLQLFVKIFTRGKVIGQNVQQNATAHITEVLPLHMCCLCLYFYLKYFL